jgi:hypothetical protein
MEAGMDKILLEWELIPQQYVSSSLLTCIAVGNLIVFVNSLPDVGILNIVYLSDKIEKYEKMLRHDLSLRLSFKVIESFCIFQLLKFN